MKFCNHWHMFSLQSFVPQDNHLDAWKGDVTVMYSSVQLCMVMYSIYIYICIYIYIHMYIYTYIYVTMWYLKRVVSTDSNHPPLQEAVLTETATCRPVAGGFQRGLTKVEACRLVELTPMGLSSKETCPSPENFVVAIPGTSPRLAALGETFRNLNRGGDDR